MVLFPPHGTRQEFHGKFYHPSNSRVWFYGDDDPDTRLKLLAEYLDQFENNPQAAPASQVAFQPLFTEPKKVVSTYPVGEDEEGEGEGGIGKKKRHMVSLNWLLSDQQLSLEDELALGFLDNLLLGTPGAPLRKRLLESGLGEALVSSGLDTDLLQVCAVSLLWAYRCQHQGLSVLGPGLTGALQGPYRVGS